MQQEKCSAVKPPWERILSLMQAHGMGKAELADVAGVGASAVTKWATGGSIRPAHLKTLANHFGVTVDWLLGGPATIQVGAPPATYQVREMAAVDRGKPPAVDVVAELARLRADCEKVQQTLDHQQIQINTLLQLLGAPLRKGNTSAREPGRKAG